MNMWIKGLGVSVLAVYGTIGVAQAADQGNTISHSSQSQASLSKKTTSTQNESQGNPSFRPVPTGIVTTIYKNGWVAVSPVAPASYGVGYYNMTAAVPSPLAQPTATHEGSREDQREAGGFKVFGWDF